MNINSAIALKILISGNPIAKDKLAGQNEILKSSIISPLFKSDTSLKADSAIERKKPDIEEKTKSDPKATAIRQGTEAFLNMMQEHSDEIRAYQFDKSDDSEALQTEYNQLQDLQSKSSIDRDATEFTIENKVRMQDLGRLLTFRTMEQRLDWAITGKDPFESNNEQMLKNLRESENEARAKGEDASHISNSISHIMQVISVSPAISAYVRAQNSEAIAQFLNSLETNNYNDGTKNGYSLMSDSLKSKVAIWRRDFTSDPKLHDIVESGRKQNLKDLERTVDEVLSGNVKVDTREKDLDRQIEGFQRRLKLEQDLGHDVSPCIVALKNLEYDKKNLANHPWDPQSDNKKIDMFFSTIEDGTFQAGVKAGYSDMSDSLKAKLDIWKRDFRPALTKTA